MSDRQASSQAAWALITEGVTAARVEAHRIRHLISRAEKLVQQSEYRDHLYQVAGDIIQGLPNRLVALEADLDKTAFALVKMGDVFLESRMPFSDKAEVDEAVEPAFGGGGIRYSNEEMEAASRVASRWRGKAGG